MAWPDENDFAYALSDAVDDFRQWRAQRRAYACAERIARALGVFSLPTEDGARVFGEVTALETSVDLIVRRTRWPGGIFGRPVESALLEVPLHAEALFAPLRTGNGLRVSDCLSAPGAGLDEAVRAELRPLEALEVVIRADCLEAELSPRRRTSWKAWADQLCEQTRQLARAAVRLDRLARAAHPERAGAAGLSGRGRAE